LHPPRLQATINDADVLQAVFPEIKPVDGVLLAEAATSVMQLYGDDQVAGNITVNADGVITEFVRTGPV
jgi:hypothetical protein